MSIDAHQAAALIASHAHTRTAAVGGTIGQDFCQIWPIAKPALSNILGVLGFFPIGPLATAVGVLEGLIKVGDQIATQVCSTPHHP